MKVRIEHVEYLREEIRKINSAKLEDIEFTRNRKIIEVSEKAIENWKFTGLSNVDFVQFVGGEALGGLE